MARWQVDFYKVSTADESVRGSWQLLICDDRAQIVREAVCPQSEVSASWLTCQLEKAGEDGFPEVIQVFRPQSLSLIATAAAQLGIEVEATRRTGALKALLQARGMPLHLEKPPPQPLPDNLWGESWRFATLQAGDIGKNFPNRPLPILEMPTDLSPVNLGLASTVSVPGTIIYGGRKSLYLARWLQEVKPVALNYVAGEIDPSGGLVLEAGLCDRWILATFTDAEVAKAAQLYQQRQQASRGLHFLLVQPDDSGMTYTGFWLLKEV